MKAAQLNSRSMTLEKTASSVALLKNPSHANAAPQAKAERRSSLPSKVEIPDNQPDSVCHEIGVCLPIDKMARLTYWATYDCLSIHRFFSAIFMIFRADQPKRAPMTIPRRTS